MEVKTPIERSGPTPDNPWYVIPMYASTNSYPYLLPAFYNKVYRIIPIQTSPLTKSFPQKIFLNRVTKRFVDILLSSLLILGVLSWLVPLMALLIRFDSKGPVFFIQKRNGKNRNVFYCIKFRSMRENREADLKPATHNDERITRLGKYLRKYYLDELPQLFNVFVGDMSLIGPRPHMLADNRKYEAIIDHYNIRYQVKPGITGLAQVLGYVGHTEDEQRMVTRIQLDILYIRHWTLGSDIRILFKSIGRILVGVKSFR